MQAPVSGRAHRHHAGKIGVVDRVAQDGDAAHRSSHDDDGQAGHAGLGDGGGHIVALVVAEGARSAGGAVTPRVVGEDIETVTKLQYLKSHGCEEAQGYLISRPLEEPELRAWWKMQDEENRIVGRQPELWRQDAS